MIPVSNREQGERWLDQARADLKTATDCLKDGNYYASAFFSQQSAEKALKGLLYAQGLRAVLTHSVTELLEQAARWHSPLQGLRDYGLELDRHYIAARYPNFYPAGAPHHYYNEEIAKRCLNYAASILTSVTGFMPT